MSSQSNQCEKCGEKYMDIYIKWCKPCHINYLKNNFTNWTSGNEKIDIFIQEMQLKIIYYSDIVVEWVPYNQFIDIIKIRNDDDNVATMYSTLWNNGPLNYDNNKKEWIRESNKRVILKYLTLDVDEFLNEAKNYSISNKIYGISQNPDTKVYILICQDGYCENCGKEYTDIFNWCKPCHINYLINNFTNWTSEDEKINNMIQKMQLATDYYGQTVVEWVPFNQLIDIKEIKKGDSNVAIIYSALWNSGPLYYDNDERKWVRESNSKVTLKCLALDINEFLKEIKNYIINNVIYGISQNPNTKDYIIVCQDEYCGECGEQYTDMYTKWCKPCYINYLKDDFTNWSSGNKEIDIFIQGMQLAIDIFDRTIIEWIPYDQFINIKEVGIEIYTAIWNNGPLEFKKKRIRESNKKVTLKCLSLDINEFLNEVKNYIRLNYIYGISQNPNTKDYIIVCQDEQCEECGEQYADLNYNWCKSCHMTHLKNKFTNWTSGNEEINIFIQEMQLNISNHYDIIVEWIPYNQLIDIKKMEYDNDGNDDVFTKYSAIWNNGPLNYDDYKKEWTRISNKEVALITLKPLDSNSYNMIDEFLNKVKDYSTNPSDGIGIYGISQNPDTKNYIMVLQDQYCVKCGDHYIDLYNKWCKPCQINCLKNNFINWTSENEKIDDFIQEIQLKINRYDDIILEWIPYTQFYRVEKIDKGGFATVYSAIWKDGPLTYDRHKKKYEREYFKEVALKSLDNSQNITNEFINEVKTYSIKSYSHSTIIKIYGISQDPDTKNYIMVLQYAKCGNFNNWIRYYSENINYSAKLEVLCNIFNGLKEIHQMKMVHRDFHIGNILINNDHNLTLPNNNRYHLSTDINLPVAAYISDMGLCGEASNTDKTKIYGVMPYVAPEVLRDKPYTQAADVYSFGMVMYFIITGRQPFENRAHDHQLVLSICNGIRPEILEIPELKSNWYIDLMKKCWDQNPENRPNVESIGTILYDTNRLTLMDELEKAEKYLFDKGHREDDQLTTSPQTSYKSQVLNHYISEDLEAFDFTELDMKN